MSLLTKSNNKVSSRRQIGIDGVEDGILKMPNNRYAVIMKVSSINLGLKSEKEKDAIIEAYKNFLNSLACPIDILIRIREIDVDKYLDDYRARMDEETEEVYKKSIEAYISFVRGLIKTNKILTRHFYIVIPFDNRDKLGFGVVKDQLTLHTSIIEDGLNKLGMKTCQLGSLDVLDLFYTFYNADQAKLQPLTVQTMQMLTSQFEA